MEEKGHLWQKQTEASAVARDRSPESRRWHGSWWVCIAGGPPRPCEGICTWFLKAREAFWGFSARNDIISLAPQVLVLWQGTRESQESGRWPWGP